MVRRTKADAEATRHRLLDAAEQLFQTKGVSRTTLNDIAQAADATRGAVYWHFKDKADLFNAMMERVTLPLEQALESATAALKGNALQSMCQPLFFAMRQVMEDPHTRRVFEVATHMVEYSNDMLAVRERHLQVRGDCMGLTRNGLADAAQQAGITLAMPLEAAVQGFQALIDGLFENWLLTPEAFDLEILGRQVVAAYLRGLGFPADQVEALQRERAANPLAS